MVGEDLPPAWVFTLNARKIKHNVHQGVVAGARLRPLCGATYGKISIGVPSSVAAQISSISALLTAMQPSVQSQLRLP